MALRMPEYWGPLVQFRARLETVREALNWIAAMKPEPERWKNLDEAVSNAQLATHPLHTHQNPATDEEHGLATLKVDAYLWWMPMHVALEYFRLNKGGTDHVVMAGNILADLTALISVIDEAQAAYHASKAPEIPPHIVASFRKRFSNRITPAVAASQHRSRAARLLNELVRAV